MTALTLVMASVGGVGDWPRSPALAAVVSEQVRIVGLTLTIEPTSIVGAPRNVPLLLATRLNDSAGNEVRNEEFLSGFAVRGTLNGPGLTQSAEVVTIPGEPLEIGTGSDTPYVIPGPPLGVPGTYTIDNLRLTNVEGETIISATPSVVTITVVDKVLSYGLTSRPLSLEEIRDRGIVIDESSYTAYEFSFTVDTESGVVTVPFDVAFPQDDEELEGGGPFTFPPILPGLNVPNLNIEGILLEHEPLEYPVDIPPIPGVLVIPGNIAFLNQFFQVQLLVANVAPLGSQLVVTSATAELLLPPGGDGIPASADDPLAARRETSLSNAGAVGAVLCSRRASRGCASLGERRSRTVGSSPRVGPLDAAERPNKVLQPTRAAAPNDRREPARRGPRG